MIEPELFNFKPPLKKHSYIKKHWDKILSDVDEYGLTHSVRLTFFVILYNYITKYYNIWIQIDLTCYRFLSSYLIQFSFPTILKTYFLKMVNTT